MYGIVQKGIDTHEDFKREEPNSTLCGGNNYSNLYLDRINATRCAPQDGYKPQSEWGGSSMYNNFDDIYRYHLNNIVYDNKHNNQEVDNFYTADNFSDNDNRDYEPDDCCCD